MLFYGPPGTGKTFITKKLAEELECGFVSKNMGEFGSSYVHQTTKNIKDFFEAVKKASEQEPILLFLDEIDSLVSARTSNIDSNKAEEVSQFLQEFNSLEDFPNLIVIAATNRPDHLDPAILRSGRLDKKIYI
jgi:transitional endoplasmic reticulum ATPase